MMGGAGAAGGASAAAGTAGADVAGEMMTAGSTPAAGSGATFGSLIKDGWADMNSAGAKKKRQAGAMSAMQQSMAQNGSGLDLMSLIMGG